MKMFKVTKVQKRKFDGKNWVKYMGAKTIDEVIEHFGAENILKIEEA